MNASRKWSRLSRALALVLLGSTAGVFATGQDIQLGDSGLNAGGVHRQHVELLTESVQVKVGRPDWIELRFRIDPGLHINSHAPHDELLVPTTFQMTSPAIRVVGQEYPAGVPLRLEIGSGETLSTYQGEFRVLLQVVAQQATELQGTLHYQACDARACFPPKTLPVHVSVGTR